MRSLSPQQAQAIGPGSRARESGNALRYLCVQLAAMGATSPGVPVPMMAQKLRRENPGLDEAVIKRLLVAWLQDRPGAPFGDAPGRAVAWPRSER